MVSLRPLVSSTGYGGDDRALGSLFYLYDIFMIREWQVRAPVRLFIHTSSARIQINSEQLPRVWNIF